MFITLTLIGLFAILGSIKIITARQTRKYLEAETNCKLALEAQRFEKIKEILTDGVIDGSPKALEALKPMVEVLANQMSGEQITKQKELDHEHRMAEIEAMNEPHRLYAKQIHNAQLVATTAKGLQMELDALRKANEGLLPNLVSDASLKLVSPTIRDFTLSRKEK